MLFSPAPSYIRETYKRLKNKNHLNYHENNRWWCPPTKSPASFLIACAYFSTHVFFLNTITPFKFAAVLKLQLLGVEISSSDQIHWSKSNTSGGVSTWAQGKLSSCWRAGLWSLSPQLTPPNPHSSPCRLPEEICLYPVNVVQRVHCVCVSLFFSRTYIFLCFTSCIPATRHFTSYTL